ncbi:lipopolysaccharide biosynthesis protein [Crocinitomix catalasitica]|uniref:lipopolysaccharide biosynthesis protein n=1 Tax=Crocinitomix catalasitica TaxID=184607 RepID=UPI000482C1C6|nr:polysaccharide biosynthesis C-terminal domain-containing protein [Crocinitomix catalasitica]
MGIIQKQATLSTIFIFGGILFGTVSRLLMPFILTKNQVGTLALLDSVSSVLSTFFCLGFTQITLNSFSNFKNEKNGHSGYFAFALFVTIIGIVLGVSTFIFFKDFLVGTEVSNQTIQAFSILLIPLIIFQIFAKNMDIYLRMLYSSVIGTFWESFILKILLLLVLIVFWSGVIDFEHLIYLYVVAFSLPGLALLITAVSKTGKLILPKKENFTASARKKIYGFGLYGILATASSMIIISVDQLMINRMLGTDALGIYAIMFFAGILVSVPSRGVKRISVAVLSDSWKNNDLKNIQSVYEKSSLTNLILGGFLFTIGWACIELALYYLPDYKEGLYVFFFIGLAQLVEMMTGVNSEIIATSRVYRANTYFNIGLAVLAIILNYFLISLYGIVGAAIASFLAVIIINSLRCLYLIKKYKLQPFNRKFAVVLFILAGLILAVNFMNFNLPTHFEIVARLIFWATIYWVIILKFKFSEDINGWFNKIIKR